jgi:hypothetical protein
MNLFTGVPFIPQPKGKGFSQVNISNTKNLSFHHPTKSPKRDSQLKLGYSLGSEKILSPPSARLLCMDLPITQ